MQINVAKPGSAEAVLPRAWGGPVRSVACCCMLALCAQQAMGAEPSTKHSRVGETSQPQAALTAIAGTNQQTLEDAVASVLVVALTQQFQGSQISVEVDTHDITVSGARERMVSGEGRLRLGADRPGWVRFSYRTVYDVVSTNASYPVIALGASAGDSERIAPNDATLLRQLDDQVVDALSRELGGTRVWLQLDTIQSFEQGDRYVRINASGVADLGLQGTTPVRVEGLYDRSAATWLRLTYDLAQQYAAATGQW